MYTVSKCSKVFFLQFCWKNILVINAIARDFHVRELIGIADTAHILSSLSLSFFSAVELKKIMSFLYNSLYQI